MAPSDQKVTIVLNSHNRPATLLRILGTIVQHYKNINTHKKDQTTFLNFVIIRDYLL